MSLSDIDALKAHIARLEEQLEAAKTVLQISEARGTQNHEQGRECLPCGSGGFDDFTSVASLYVPSVLHNLLLLSDSALPIGSFAYSNGLESFLAHHKPLPAGESTMSLFHKFLTLSVQTMAYTSVPYMLTAFSDPSAITELDNDLDASTTCSVARRASVAQGRALLGVWEKALVHETAEGVTGPRMDATNALKAFISNLRQAEGFSDHLPVNSHLAPLWGTISRSLGLTSDEAGYVFLLNHARAVISAGVRSSVMGPYMAQKVLASSNLKALLRKCLERVWFIRPEDAGLVVPMMDLWMGRHEKLYSRIFNS